MRRFLFIVFLLLLPQTAQAAQTYTFDPAHTAVDWRVRVFGISTANGIFKIKQGVVTIDEAAPAHSTVRVVIDTGSLSSGTAALDKLLKGRGFLESDKYPRASFKSTKVKLSKSGRAATVSGLLTLHDVTRPVTLDVTLEKQGRGMMVFKAATTIRRMDFGIVRYRAIASDEVNLTIEAEATVQ